MPPSTDKVVMVVAVDTDMMVVWAHERGEDAHAAEAVVHVEVVGFCNEVVRVYAVAVAVHVVGEAAKMVGIGGERVVVCIDKEAVMVAHEEALVYVVVVDV